MTTAKEIRERNRLTANVGTPLEHVDRVRDRSALKGYVQDKLLWALGRMALDRAVVAFFRPTDPALPIVESTAEVYAFSEAELIEYTRAVRKEAIRDHDAQHVPEAKK